MHQSTIDFTEGSSEISRQLFNGQVASSLYYKTLDMNETGAALIELEAQLDLLTPEEVRAPVGSEILDSHCALLAKLYRQITELAECIEKAEQSLISLPTLLHNEAVCERACFAFNIRNAREDLAVWRSHLCDNNPD